MEVSIGYLRAYLSDVDLLSTILIEWKYFSGSPLFDKFSFSLDMEK